MQILKEMAEQQCFFVIEKSEETVFNVEQNSKTVNVTKTLSIYIYIKVYTFKTIL